MLVFHDILFLYLFFLNNYDTEIFTQNYMYDIILLFSLSF